MAAGDVTTEADGATRLWKQLVSVQNEQNWGEAASVADQFIAEWPDDPRRRKAELNRLWALCRLARWPEVEALARAAMIDFPNAPEWSDYVAEALFRQGHADQAMRLVEAAIEIHPERVEPRALRAAIQAETAPAEGKPRRKIRIWPSIGAFEDPRKLIRTYLLQGLPARPMIRPGTVFMTLGSCFADNLAARLRANGYAVNAEGIGEDVNSTYANRYLLEWIEQGAVSDQTRIMDDFYGPEMRERFRRAIEASDIFVLTLGVAPAFFQKETGEFVFVRPRSTSSKQFLYEEHVMRTTSVAENVENANAIIDVVRRMSPRDIKIVLTVSPVPLGATTEFHSAAIADCISKSTLRLACHEVVGARAKDGVLYWPSFEVAKWFGPHFGHDVPRVYGEHDGHSRHVSSWLVDLIVDLFLEHFADKAPEPVA